MAQRSGTREVVLAVASVIITGCAWARGAGDALPVPAPGDEGTLRVVEEMRIGVATEPEELRFRNIDDAVVGDDGTLFVVDRLPQGSPGMRLRAYDEQGRFLRQLGPFGEEPGTWQGIHGLNVLSDGRLAVHSAKPATVSLYRGTGDYEGGFVLDVGTSIDIKSMRAASGGQVTVHASRAVQRPSARPTRADVSQDTRFLGSSGLEHVSVRFSERGHVLEARATQSLPLSEPEPEFQFALRRPSGMLSPFTTQTSYCWSADGYLVVGRNDVYEIEVRSHEKSTLLTREVAPVPVGSNEREEWEMWVDYVHERTVSRSHRQHPAIPTSKPYFRDILCDPEGRIWIHRYVEAGRREPVPRPANNTPSELSWIEPPTFDIFEKGGAFLGTVVLPDDSRVVALRGARVWVVHTDDVGVERLVRLRVEPRPE